MNAGEIGMVEFVVTFLFFLLIIIVMAVGVMRGREPISGCLLYTSDAADE